MAVSVIELGEHLEIHESATTDGSAGPVRADGLVPIYVIRPGLGRGKGRHLYEAEMLERNASVFKGWKMFLNHQSAEAKRALGGLPRPIQDLGGIVKESWWDPNVPADVQRGHGQGAVIALVKPAPLVRQLIETDPALVEASISATATAVRPVQHGGKTAWLVEGFQPAGSVDWVSAAGAGGRVAQLAEALEESLATEEGALMLLDALGDDELVEHLMKERPELAAVIEEAVLTAKARKDLDDSDFAVPEDRSYPIHDEAHARNALSRVAENGTPDEQSKVRSAVKKRYPNIDVSEAASELDENLTEEDEMKTPTEILTEALDTDEGKALIEGIVETRFAEIAAPKLAELVEAAMEEDREVIVAEAQARADRKLEVRDLQDQARGLIEAARLPDTFKRELSARFSLTESGEPSAALDVAPEKDDAGKVVKPVGEVLEAAVKAAIKEKQDQWAEIAPTSVRAPRPVAEATDGPDLEPDGDDDETKTKAKAKAKAQEAKSTGSEDTDRMLRNAGVEIDESLYEDIYP